MSDDSHSSNNLTLGKLGKFTIITRYREGLLIDELVSLLTELEPKTARKNKSDRKRNRKQRWC